MNSKDTSSKKQGKSSVTNNNISDKNVTHTDHRSKTKSNSLTNSDSEKSGATESKRPSSGNIRGV